VPGDSAQVVIIGGGAMGTSAAFHLAQLGVTDVVLCERETLGSGSTSKSAGGIRAQFADEINIRIALISLLEFRNFAEKIGTDIDFRETGYLFLLDTDDDVSRFREAVRLQGSLGVLSTELTLDEVLELVPQLSTEGLRGATYCPRDGFATPEAVVRGYAAAAAEQGVRI
jgi:sarcosine oxidase subunit beta